MDSAIREKLIEIAKERISNGDISHDLEHTLRVLSNAENISKIEGGDLEVIIPAALFHDLIVYPKNHKDRYKSQEESAEQAGLILKSLKEFPEEKIEKVKICILQCSFSKGIMPEMLESKILQDADGLEATGAISIMRTFASSSQMKRIFYDPKDPFCKTREPSPFEYGIDVFYSILFKATDKMHTKTAKVISIRRTKFLVSFLDELKLELEGK